MIDLGKIMREYQEWIDDDPGLGLQLNQFDNNSAMLEQLVAQGMGWA